MNRNRRKILKAIGGAGAVAAAQPYLSFPALAQTGPLRVGIIAPKAGIAGTIGECGLRGTMFAVDRINAAGAMALMHSLSRRFWYIHYKQAADMPLTAKLHADIARAIADGDEARAAKATDRLIDAIEKFTRDTVDTDVT